MESESIPLYQQKSTLPPAEGCASRRDIQVYGIALLPPANGI